MFIVLVINILISNNSKGNREIKFESESRR